MRAEANAQKVREAMAAIGRESTGPGTVFVTGGGSAVLIGWRDTTIDLDIKLDPEPDGVFAALARIKNRLDMNIELASPDLFLPPVPGWRERSVLIDHMGSVEFRHYDFSSQALSKIERGHARDLKDVRAMLKHKLVDLQAIEDAYTSIQEGLLRYPSIDPDALLEKVQGFLHQARHGN